MDNDYFDGHITDGKMRMRRVGFNKQQQKLTNSLEQKEPVVLSNCDIVKSPRSDDIEIKLKSCFSVSPEI